MGSDNPSSSSDSPGMSSGALMDILRKGSSALLPGTEMELSQFIQAPIAEILGTSKAREEARDAKMLQSLQDSVGTVKTEEGDIKIEDPDTHAAKLLKEAEEEEQRLLSGAAQVRCRMLEGRELERAGSGQSYKHISDEWTNLQKRAKKTRETVVIGGMTFVVDPDPDDVQHKPVSDVNTFSYTTTYAHRSVLFPRL